METIKQAIGWLMTHEWSGRESLCKCINNKYDGDVSKFLENEFNVIKDNILHVKWGDGKNEKVSYDL